MSFAVGTYGLDNAATVDYGAAHASGARYQMRYSAGLGNDPKVSPQSQFKLCKSGEITEVCAAGLDFLANSEWSASRVTQGAAAGELDGESDLAFWQSRGYAKGASIYPSWDTAPSTAFYDAVAAYLKAHDAAQSGRYRTNGLYAGMPALNEMADRGLITHAWIPSAPSWSVPNAPIDPSYAPPAKTLWDLWSPTPSQVESAGRLLASMLHPSLVSVIWQTRNQWPNGSDENVIIRCGPLGSHLEALDPTPEVYTVKDIVYVQGAVGGPVWLREASGAVYGLQNAADVAAVEAGGAVNVGTVSNGLHREFLDASPWQQNYAVVNGFGGRNNAGPNGNTPA